MNVGLIKGFSPSIRKDGSTSHKKSNLTNEMKELRQRERSLEQEINRIKKNCNNLEGKLKISENDLKNKSFKHDKECENIIKVFVNFLKKKRVKLDLTISKDNDRSLSPSKKLFAKNNKFSSDNKAINDRGFDINAVKNINSEKKDLNYTHDRGIQGSQSYTNLGTNEGTFNGNSNNMTTNQMSSFDRFKNNRISNLNTKLKKMIETGKIQVPNSNMRAISRKIPKAA